MRIRAAALGCLSLTLVTASALGATPDAKATRAQELYDRATTAMDAGDYSKACPILEEVTTLVPEGIGAVLTLAECYVGEGKLASALARYAAAAEASRRAGQLERAKKAEKKVSELDQRVGRVRVELGGMVRSSPGLVITRDGKSITADEWNAPLDRGEHSIEVSASGHSTVRATVVVSDGEEALFQLADWPRRASPAPLAQATQIGRAHV